MVLRQDQDHPLGLFTVERFRAPLFQRFYFRVVHGAARAEVLVPLAHVAVREPRLFVQHLVDHLVQAVDVLGKRLAGLHVRHSEGHIFVVCN